MSETRNPTSVEPMKAKLTGRPFADPDWVFERRLDGVRAIVVKHDGEVRLLSRTGRRLIAYPEFIEPRRAAAVMGAT